MCYVRKVYNVTDINRLYTDINLSYKKCALFSIVKILFVGNETGKINLIKLKNRSKVYFRNTNTYFNVLGSIRLINYLVTLILKFDNCRASKI
jgi:hypothetical protein